MLTAGKPSPLTVQDLPPEEKWDWDADQETRRVAREDQITAAQSRIAKLNEQIAAETDLEKKARLIEQRDAIKVPSLYVKKRPQKYLVDRGVKSAIVEV